MGAVLLTGQRMILESESYIDAMHGILFPMGWIACSKSMLAGMSAAAFRFTVNRRLTPESVTAYNWMAEHFLAADFLGVTASQNAGFYFQPTFPLYQRQAVAAIKDSLDRGTGAVIWKDKFVIAAGYDDEREVLYISDGTAEDYEALPYGDFGCNRSPYWYVQTFETRIESDEMEIYLESLLQAIYKWESHDLMLPEKEYACGRSAYGAIIHALRGGHYDPAGLREIIRCYGAAKRDSHAYIAALERWMPQIREAANAYARLDSIFQQLAMINAGMMPVRRLNASEAKDMIDLFDDALMVEETAIRSLKGLMRETVDNRFNDIALR